MLAVVEINGVQFEVQKDIKLNVPYIVGNPGDSFEFNNILLAENNGETRIGAPYLGGSVKATIVEHGRGDKILIFHKKRRKGYRKLNGHRQDFTTIEITDINLNN